MGDYRDKSGSERVDAPEKIDLTNIMLDVYHGVKRLWWLLIGLIIICAVQSYFSVSTSYQSKYVASATVSVTSAGGMDYVDAQSAQQMAEVFPYILTSGASARSSDGAVSRMIMSYLDFWQMHRFWANM